MLQDISWIRRSSGWPAAVAGLLFLAGCGSTAGPVVGAAAESVRPAPSATAGSAPSATAGSTPSATAGSAPTPYASSVGAIEAQLAVPVTFVSNAGDQAYLTAQVSIGGGPPATLWLDTGSSGILVNSSAVGPDITTSSTPVGIDYTSGALVGSVATATVDIGGVETAEPITFALLDEKKSTFQTPPGTVGIMGIGTDDDSDVSSQQIFAPQLQLPAPYNAGSTLQVVDTGTGSWLLGPVPDTDGEVSIPLTVNTSSTTGVPAGYPALLRPVDLCWTIGTAAATCGPTDLDTGSPVTLLSASDYTDLAASGRFLADPTPMTAATTGGAAVWSFTSGTTAADDGVAVADIGTSQFNTGLGFFVGRTVAWDYTGSRLLIGPGA